MDRDPQRSGHAPPARKRGGFMKRIVSAVVAALWLSAGAAHAVSLGGGVFGGASIPVVQGDTKTGSQFGLRVLIGAVPMLSVEPYVAFSSLGDASKNLGGFDYTRSGFDATAFGLNVLLGGPGLMPGFSFFPFVGIGTEKLTRTGSADLSDVCYNVGFGLSFPLPMTGLSLNARGELNILATGDTSRKFANINGGLTYKLPLP
jgi:hypothetical protein